MNAHAVVLLEFKPPRDEIQMEFRANVSSELVIHAEHRRHGNPREHNFLVAEEGLEPPTRGL